MSIAQYTTAVPRPRNVANVLFRKRLLITLVSTASPAVPKPISVGLRVSVVNLSPEITTTETPRTTELAQRKAN